MNIQGWFPSGLTRLISLLSKGLSRVLSSTTVQKHQFFSTSAVFMVKLSHPYMTTGKTIALTIWTFVGKVMSLIFNTLYRFVIAFLPRSKCLLISWLQSLSTVILEPNKTKSITVSIFPHLFAMKWWTGHHDPSVLNAESEASFFTLLFYLYQRLFSGFLLSAIRTMLYAYLRLLIISPGNLDSSLYFIQPSISHDVLCM